MEETKDEDVSNAGEKKEYELRPSFLTEERGK